MKNLLIKGASAVLALAMAGCAQVGGGLQKAGAAIADAGKPTEQKTATVEAPPAPEKPKTAIEICADNNVTLNYGNKPTGGAHSVRVRDLDGTPVYMEIQQAQSPGGALVGMVSGHFVNSTKYAACTEAVTGKKVPQSCVDAKALVAFNTVSGVNTAARGYETMTFPGKDGKPSAVAQMPALNGGVVNWGYPSKPGDRSACSKELAQKAVTPAPAKH